MTRKMPGAAGDLAEAHPDIWSAYSPLCKATAEAGPLTARERRLVKLALSVGCRARLQRGRGSATGRADLPGRFTAAG